MVSVLLGFLIIVTFGVGLTILQARKTRKKFEKFIEELGFKICEENREKLEFADKVKIVNLRHSGKRLVLNLYKRKSLESGIEFSICDYVFSSAGGRASGSKWRIVGMSSPNLNFPFLFIDNLNSAKSGALSRIAKKISVSEKVKGMDLVDTRDPVLEQKLTVFIDDKRNMSPRIEALLVLLSKSKINSNIYTKGEDLFLAEPSDGPGKMQIYDDLRIKIDLIDRIYENFRN
jgi:hypothetical protein